MKRYLTWCPNNVPNSRKPRQGRCLTHAPVRWPLRCAQTPGVRIIQRHSDIKTLCYGSAKVCVNLYGPAQRTDSPQQECWHAAVGWPPLDSVVPRGIPIHLLHTSPDHSCAQPVGGEAFGLNRTMTSSSSPTGGSPVRVAAKRPGSRLAASEGNVRRRSPASKAL